MKKQNNGTVGIYKITSPSNRIYIGQSINIEKRYKIYKGNYDNSQPKLYRSFQKYEFNNHTFEIIEECPESYLDELETWWKLFYNSVEDGLNCGYWDGGGGPMSNEIKCKISKAKKGHICYQDNKRGEKISQKLMGRKITWERGGKKNKGKLKPEGFGDMVSKNKSKPVLQYDLKGNFIKEWLSLKEAGNMLNIHPNCIGACLKNKTKTAGKFKWKYKL